MEIALIVILAICLICIIIWFIRREFKWRNIESLLKQEIARQKQDLAQRPTQEEIDKQMNKALRGQLSNVKGTIHEQVAPVFPEFFSKYKSGDCRFIGKPIDFIVFQGLTEEEPQKIIFVEVKTGEAKVQGIEVKIKKLVESIHSQTDKVDWDLVRLKTEAEESPTMP